IFWKSISGYWKFGQADGSCIFSQPRYAFRRNSSIHSGSFFFEEISRTVSSLKPFGMVSDSMSVTKPYLYSRFVNNSAAVDIKPFHHRGTETQSFFELRYIFLPAFAFSVPPCLCGLNSLWLNGAVNSLYL